MNDEIDLQLTKWDLHGIGRISEGFRSRGEEGKGKGKRTDHAELETRLAVSTVPPSITSFIPSSILEPPTPPTRGCTRDLITSIGDSDYVRKCLSMGEGKKGEMGNVEGSGCCVRMKGLCGVVRL